MKSKEHFINKCGVCGTDEECLSTIEMHANYGSRYDGTHATLHLCGKCFDVIYGIVNGQAQLDRHNYLGACDE